MFRAIILSIFCLVIFSDMGCNNKKTNEYSSKGAETEYGQDSTTSLRSIDLEHTEAVGPLQEDTVTFNFLTFPTLRTLIEEKTNIHNKQIIDFLESIYSPVYKIFVFLGLLIRLPILLLFIMSIILSVCFPGLKYYFIIFVLYLFGSIVIFR